ncbi:MAG: type II toxin-antitoxin system VapC family toxin [Gemmatimonadota bacterium]
MKHDPAVWKARQHPDFAGPLLLDTHIWVWYLDGVKGRMSSAAVDLLKRCVKENLAQVSDISIWELANKASKGQIELKPNTSAWLRRAEGQSGFAFLPVDREVLLESTLLPGEVHGDPADRMIMATSALRHIALITADADIIDYVRRSPLLSVCDARR